ncbi:MAG: 4Fe-4S dicluster domain-containing protein [Phycisphaerae bacterium]|nr:4Fe-4S dicluster domain-containing protein [Phycisphaerae bacterium]
MSDRPSDQPNDASLDRRVDRRRFFRDGLRELLKPVVAAAESLQSVTDAFAEPTTTSTRIPLPQLIRPPGALNEAAFANTCSRCGDCIAVCPVRCIVIDPSRFGGLPFIDVDAAACVLCDGLKCMHVCPTGALVPTSLADIDMGTAVWQAHTCLRQRGEACTICVDHCPVGSFAIELAGKRIRVHDHGCTGCGVCQHDCPTTPKSILVQSKA